MLVLFKVDNGKSYDDFQEWIERVYDLPFGIGEVYDMYKEYILSKFQEKGLVVKTIRSGYDESLSYSFSLNESYYYEHQTGVLPKIKDPIVQRNYNQILNDNHIFNWLDNICNFTTLEFKTINL